MLKYSWDKRISMIKLIIFDLSNVCFNSEEDIFLEKFCRKHNLNLMEMSEFYYGLNEKSERDEISGEEVWKKVLTKYKIKAQPIQVMIDVMRLKKPVPKTLQFIKGLRKKYKTAYLTNYNKAYWNIMEKKFDLSEWFDYGIVSFQIKHRKPEAEGFTAIMTCFGVKPEETVFTDDAEKNLVQAGKLGIHTIHFKTIRQFKLEPQHLEIKV